jgi:hypothetical protein
MATIFDSVVTKENDHTNLLRNLMDRDAKAAALVLSFLTQRYISETEAAKYSYRTQQAFAGPDGREIPDIVVDGEGIRCLIEAKIDPELGLTPNQLDGYSRCFLPDRENYLCFLVPIDWKHYQDAKEVEASLESKNIRVSLHHWPALISEIDQEPPDGPNGELLKEIVSFWKWRFEICPMDQNERDFIKTWSGEKYRAVRKLEKTVDQAKKLFDARRSKTELETDVTTYGFYIKRDSSYLLWVGIWDLAPGPLSYGYHIDKPDWIRPKSLPPSAVTASKYHLWGLGPETWDDPELVYSNVELFLSAYFSQ